jgi:hypothetical protein
MKRTTKDLLKDSTKKSRLHPGKNDKVEGHALEGHVPKRRALSPSSPHSKTYGH